jgi:vacuolar-type H+-ATPase subunit D/Vma8
LKKLLEDIFNPFGGLFNTRRKKVKKSEIMEKVSSIETAFEFIKAEVVRFSREINASIEKVQIPEVLTMIKNLQDEIFKKLNVISVSHDQLREKLNAEFFEAKKDLEIWKANQEKNIKIALESFRKELSLLKNGR